MANQVFGDIQLRGWSLASGKTQPQEVMPSNWVLLTHGGSQGWKGKEPLTGTHPQARDHYLPVGRLY
jgi:hypothetical protein